LKQETAIVFEIQNPTLVQRVYSKMESGQLFNIDELIENALRR